MYSHHSLLWPVIQVLDYIQNVGVWPFSPSPMDAVKKDVHDFLGQVAKDIYYQGATHGFLAGWLLTLTIGVLFLLYTRNGKSHG